MLAWLIYNHTANSSYLVEPSPTLHPLLVVAITSDEELAKLAKKKTVPGNTSETTIWARLAYAAIF
jgi:hypothetical protein